MPPIAPATRGRLTVICGRSAGAAAQPIAPSCRVEGSRSGSASHGRSQSAKTRRAFLRSICTLADWTRGDVGKLLTLPSAVLRCPERRNGGTLRYLCILAHEASVVGDDQSMQNAPRVRLAINRVGSTLVGLSRAGAERMRSMQLTTTHVLRLTAHASQRRASAVLGIGVERDKGFSNVSAGDPYPVRCPRCGGSTRRIPRLPADRFLSVFMRVWRFRCTDPACGWEDPVRMRNTDFQQLR